MRLPVHHEAEASDLSDPWVYEEDGVRGEGAQHQGSAVQVEHSFTNLEN